MYDQVDERWVELYNAEEDNLFTPPESPSIQPFLFCPLLRETPLLHPRSAVLGTCKLTDGSRRAMKR